MRFLDLLQEQLAAAIDAAEAAQVLGDTELEGIWRSRIAALQRYCSDLAAPAISTGISLPEQQTGATAVACS